MPSGVWAPSEYAKLPAYDAETYRQPPGLFLCHQTERDDPNRRVCAGWLGCHNRQDREHDLLSLRLAPALGVVTADEAAAMWAYTTDVPLFPSGSVAAAHGMDEIDYPGVEAERAMRKVARRRDVKRRR